MKIFYFSHISYEINNDNEFLVIRICVDRAGLEVQEKMNCYKDI